MQAIKLNSDISLFWSNLYDLYFKTGNNEGIIKCIDNLLRIEPFNSLFWNNKGVYNLSTDNKEEAEGNFEKAISLDPQNAFLAYSNLGYIYNLNARYDEAIIFIKKAINIRPSSALPYANLAVSYFYKGDAANNRGITDKAEQYYEKGAVYLNMFINRNEIDGIFYTKGTPVLEEIGKMMYDIINKIPSNENSLIDLLKKAYEKFKEHSNK